MKTLKHYSSLIFGCFFVLLSTLLLIAGERLIEGEQRIVALQATQQAGSEDLLEQDIDNDDSDQIRKLLMEAQQMSAQQNKVSALQRYEQVLILNQSHQVAALNKAILMKSEMGCEIANEAIQHAVNNNRGARLAKSLSLQASCLVEQQQPEKAIRTLKKAIEYFPNHDLLWKKLARIQRDHSDNTDEVLLTYKRALALATKDKNLRIEVAEFQQQNLDFRGSVHTLKSAYRQLRRDYQSQYILAWNYLELGMPINASKHIRLAGRLNKSKRPILDAMQLYLNEDYDASIILLKKELRRQRSGRYLLALNYVAKSWPKNAQRFLSLLADKKDYSTRADLQAWYLDEEKPLDQKIHTITQIQQRTLSASYLNELAAQLLLSKQRPQPAVQWLKPLNFPAPSSQLNKLHIEALWASGDRQSVYSMLERLQKTDTRDPRLLRLHAQYLTLDQKPLEALKKLQSIPNSDLEKDDFHNIADLAIQLKEINMAIGILKSATEQFPESADTRLRLAQALFHNQATQKSRKQLELLLRLEPQHPAGLKFLSENF